jgi:serine protease Do
MFEKGGRHTGVLYYPQKHMNHFEWNDKPMETTTTMKKVFTGFSRRLVAFTLGGALLGVSAVAFTQKPKAEPYTPPAVDQRPISRELGGRTSFAPVVKRVAPAVVKVVTTSKVQNAGPYVPDNNNMDQFFRRFFGEQSRGGTPRRNAPVQREQGIGSGVIATKDGYILTNNHVVDGADELKVWMQDGREFTAKVIGRDPKTDVAVIKIDAKDLPAVQLADSDKVEVGDVVLAIGNPFGIGQTVTTGIVSATGRSGTIGLDYEDFIQTDAAINPGNSGGALVDADGRLVGINTAILSRSGGNQGIGFAIPVNLARDVMGSLIKEGKVTRGYLGVSIQDLTPALAKEFKLKDNKGALVGDVTPRGPADKAGLKSGDLVLEFNDKKVQDSRHLKLEVARIHPGTTVPVKLMRDGEVKNLEVTVREMPGEQVAKNDRPAAEEDTGTLNGVAVADLDRDARQQFEVPENVRGVVVTEVAQDSAAAEAGLQSGDIIQEINRKPVRSADEAVKMTEKATDKTTLLRVWRGGGSRFVVVDESQTKNG